MGKSRFNRVMLIFLEGNQITIVFHLRTGTCSDKCIVWVDATYTDLDGTDQ
jgi:hypothetical protein